MTIWEHTFLVSDVSGTFKPNVTRVWEHKGNDGKTDWERIQQMGAEGWEIVSSFPITTGYGATIQIVWVLKRAKQ